MIYAVLLAGGLSSRMGEDKAQLKLDGLTLLEQSLELLNNCGADRILISGALDGYDCVPDILPECGPIGGLYSCLSFIKEEFGLDDSLMLIIPVDMPMLNIDALAKVLVGASNLKCCHYENEVFPCAMRASNSLFEYLENSFDESTELGGKRSMKGLMKFLDAKKISAEGLPEDIFLNVNRPDEWKKFISKQSIKFKG